MNPGIDLLDHPLCNGTVDEMVDDTNPEILLLRREIVTVFLEAVRSLPNRQKHLFTAWHELNGKRRPTLDRLARKYPGPKGGSSPENARQEIERAARQIARTLYKKLGDPHVEGAGKRESKLPLPVRRPCQSCGKEGEWYPQTFRNDPRQRKFRVCEECWRSMAEGEYVIAMICADVRRVHRLVARMSHEEINGLPTGQFFAYCRQRAELIWKEREKERKQKSPPA